ncbi:hypothetical protein [Pigmentiphaga aceris]|uniref:hypothetical protein n=1 Tax=Pigmentiphaga aceris TaxID=1940612 RepID=UPI001652527E|nr:hypothetical protein [Pigmentiphaga aceris]
MSLPQTPQEPRQEHSGWSKAILALGAWAVAPWIARVITVIALCAVAIVAIIYGRGH